MVSRNENLKLLVDAIFATIPLLVTLIFVSGVIMWIFAILMMSEFKGKFYYCYLFDKDYYEFVKDKWDCLDYGGNWINS